MSVPHVEGYEIAHVDLHQSALGNHIGHAELEIFSDFDSNDGTSRVSDGMSRAQCSVRVAIDTIDNVLGREEFAVLKLDVEGSEAHVLRGAAHALADGRIRHVVFEDHDISNSIVVGLLGQAGFGLFSLGGRCAGHEFNPWSTGPWPWNTRRRASSRHWTPTKCTHASRPAAGWG